MYIAFSQLKHFSIHATDGDIGACKDALFDDQDLVIRYFYVDTSAWLPLSRKVIITPISVTGIEHDKKAMAVAMDTETLKASPSIDTHKPVSREYEEALFKYLGYGYYWTGPGAWGDFAMPNQLVDEPVREDLTELEKTESNNHLRSCDEVDGYDVNLTGHRHGHICDFIFNTKTWAIELFIVDTNNWLPGGKKLAVSPKQLEKIDWPSQQVSLKISDGVLMQAPEVDLDKVSDSQYIEGILSKM
ncbi:PRC-barrel domain containing protein [Alteromonas sediminis]|uniref:PRC-barrel domain containing protein n=1 Tax=Alteromonas sediminis TaxID=2259342 RepID=A0A3N5ZE14_9ALTE|nr:PRC-barrel domain containing protein [Alteromonas sediminis]RPJ68498.1 PRC-barrel domain containing protein [Alteromonas sediminis]